MEILQSNRRCCPAEALQHFSRYLRMIFTFSPPLLSALKLGISVDNTNAGTTISSWGYISCCQHPQHPLKYKQQQNGAI